MCKKDERHEFGRLVADGLEPREDIIGGQTNFVIEHRPYEGSMNGTDQYGGWEYTYRNEPERLALDAFVAGIRAGIWIERDKPAVLQIQLLLRQFGGMDPLRVDADGNIIDGDSTFGWKATVARYEPPKPQLCHLCGARMEHDTTRPLEEGQCIWLVCTGCGKTAQAGDEEGDAK